MKMKTIKIILFTSWLVLTSSCSDFLLKEPHNLTAETFFNTNEELESFLTGVYAPLMSNDFYGNYYPLYNAGGDDLSFYQRSTPASSIICGNANSSNTYISFFWRILYQGINRANILLENADRNTEIPLSTRDRIKSEALFLRSFYYFHLVQGWGDVPLRLKATNQVTGLDAIRTDKQIIYNQLISDIEEAIPFLYSSSDLNYNGRVTQSAAKGILARIYLFRAGEHFRDNKPAGPEVQTYFEEAKRWALDVKNSQLHGLVSPYNQVFLDLSRDLYNSTGVNESIWEAEEAGNRATVEQAAGRMGNTTGFGSSVDYSTVVSLKNESGLKNPGYSYKFVYGSLKLYEMYDSEGDTVRGDWNIANYEYTFSSVSPRPVVGRKYYYGKLRPDITAPAGFVYTEESEAASSMVKTRCAAKFRREFETIYPKHKNYTPINFPILRYSDVLLMLAEAENEINDAPTTLAYECIDAVRTRAKIAPLSGKGLTKLEFRDAIKKERGMELSFEALRRWDLIRWGEYTKSMRDMQAVVMQDGWSSGLKYAIDYYKVSDAYNYFPIPDSETSVNKAITVNNPGW